MRPVRRYDHSPRVELMPLIDVVFLLLTFFIYAMVVMVELKSAGVALVSVQGASDAVDEEIVLLEVDANGGVLLDDVQDSRVSGCIIRHDGEDRGDFVALRLTRGSGNMIVHNVLAGQDIAPDSALAKDNLVV